MFCHEGKINIFRQANLLKKTYNRQIIFRYFKNRKLKKSKIKEVLAGESGGTNLMFAAVVSNGKSFNRQSTEITTIKTH